MQFRNKFFILSAVFVWTLSLVGNSPSAQAGFSVPAQEHPAATGPSVTVISAPALAVTAKVSSVTTPLSCQSGATLIANLIQDQGVVNLNQPGDCFTVAPVKIAVQDSLAVGSAMETASVVVANAPAPFFVPAYLAGSTPASPLPALPLPAAFLVVMAAGLMVAKSKKKTSISQRIMVSLSLPELQIMRC